MPLDIQACPAYRENFLMGIFMKSLSPSYTLTDSPVTCASSPAYSDSDDSDSPPLYGVSFCFDFGRQGLIRGDMYFVSS